VVTQINMKMEKPNFIDKELEEIAELSLQEERGELSKDEIRLLHRRLSSHSVYEDKIETLITSLRNKKSNI